MILISSIKVKNQISRTEIIVDKQNQEIKSLANKIVEVSNTIKGIGSINLENASEGILYKLSISGNISLNYPSSNEQLYGYTLLPSENLVPTETLTPSRGVPFNRNIIYPSDSLYPKSFKLQVDENIYDLDINYLNYMDSNIYDEFICELGNCYIIRRIGINESGDMYKLPNEIIEEKDDITINVLKDSKITLLGFGSAILSAEYLLQNQYTDTFATEVYVESQIKETADEINIEVSKKVNEDEVVSAINLSPEKISLESNRLKIDSTYFKLSEDGKIESTGGKIGGYELESDKFSTNIERELGFSLETQEEFNEILEKITTYISGTGTLTEEELKLYDLNFDGTVDRQDLLMIQSIYFGYLKIKGVFEINSNDATKTLNFIAEDGSEAGYIGLNGLKFYNITSTNASITNDLITQNLTVKGNFNNLSDKRVKHNIEELDNKYVNVIKELNPVSFIYNQNNTKHIGFIAQDMEKVFIDNNIEVTPVKINEDGMYSINYIDLIGILWKDNQILHEEIDKIKEMIK